MPCLIWNGAENLSAGACPALRTFQRRMLTPPAGIVVHQNRQGLEARNHREVLDIAGIPKGPRRSEPFRHSGEDGLKTLPYREPLSNDFVGRELDRGPNLRP